MTVYTKTIYIRSYNLGAEDTPFILTFNSEEITGIYRTVLPTVWKYVYYSSLLMYLI